MADDKGKKFDPKKPAGGAVSAGPSGASNPWEFLIIAAVLIVLISYAAENFSRFLGSNPLTRSLHIESLDDSIRLWFRVLLPYLQILSFLISAFLVYIIISISYRLSKIHKKVKEQFSAPKSLEMGFVSSHIVVPNPATQKWQRIVTHTESQNPNDWKIAIIEADSILDELVDSMGYRGETLGEKLKLIEQSDFTTINNAWEAHKVRNFIAHEASFQLSEREARRVIALYQSVLEEFKYI